jgi:hypothetical protein
VLKQALLTAGIWLAFGVALDLPSLVAASGVVFAFVFAWWDEQKPVDETGCADGQSEYEDDDLFEEQVTVLDV